MTDAVPAVPPPATPEMALLAAVKLHLLAEPDVSDRVDGQVYDEVPIDEKGKAREGATLPYLYVGPINAAQVEDACAVAWTIRMRLYAASTGYGHQQAWAICDAARRALHRVELDLSGPFRSCGEIRVTQSGDATAPPAPKAAFLDLMLVVLDDRFPEQE